MSDAEEPEEPADNTGAEGEPPTVRTSADGGHADRRIWALTSANVG
jgi:hypothetical protein